MEQQEVVKKQLLTSFNFEDDKLQKKEIKEEAPKEDNKNVEESVDKKDPEPNGTDQNDSPEGKEEVRNKDVDIKEEGLESTQIKKEDKETPKEGLELEDKGGVATSEDEETEFYRLAKYWQETGKLPGDIEFDKKLSDEELQEVYNNHLTNKWAQENGYSVEDLETARLLKMGVKQEDIVRAGDYDKLARVGLPEDGDAREDIFAEYLSLYYQNEKGFSKDKSDRLIKTAISSGYLDEDFKEAKDFYVQKSEEEQEKLQVEAERRRKEAEEQGKKQVKEIKQLISSKKIGGVELNDRQAKKLEKAFFDNSVVREVGGEKVKMTAYKDLVNRLSTDKEFMLESVAKLLGIVNEVSPEMEEEISERTKASILKGINKKVKDTGESGSAEKDKTDKRGIKRKPLI